MEVNVAINIKVETLFQEANVFREGAENSTRGRKYFLLERGNIPPSDFVMGRLYFVTPAREHPVISNSASVPCNRR